MLVTDLPFAYFYIWTNGCKDKNVLLLKVERDDEFCEILLQKHKQLFDRVILPELVSRKNDPHGTDDSEKQYCLCRRLSFLPMIACDGKERPLNGFTTAV